MVKAEGERLWSPRRTCAKVYMKKLWQVCYWMGQVLGDLRWSQGIHPLRWSQGIHPGGAKC